MPAFTDAIVAIIWIIGAFLDHRGQVRGIVEVSICALPALIALDVLVYVDLFESALSAETALWVSSTSMCGIFVPQ